jgi:tripartite-type tricarboxylate transporter receptor subunit TctC
MCGREQAWTHRAITAAEEARYLARSRVHPIADTSARVPYVEDGRLRRLVTSGAEPARRFPEIPTLREFWIDRLTDFRRRTRRRLRHGV